MEIVDVDVIRAEAFQAPVHRLQYPLARKPGFVGSRPAGIAELGGKHPAVAILPDRATDHLFRPAAGVLIRGVDEVHTLLARHADDPRRGRLVRRPAEIHGAEAEHRYLDPAVSERAVVHEDSPYSRSASDPPAMSRQTKHDLAARSPKPASEPEIGRSLDAILT